jgi:hypothetical protein
VGIFYYGVVGLFLERAVEVDIVLMGLHGESLLMGVNHAENDLVGLAS